MKLTSYAPIFLLIANLFCGTTLSAQHRELLDYGWRCSLRLSGLI